MKRIFTDCRVVALDTDISQPDGYQVRENQMIATENGVITAVGENLPTAGHNLVSLQNKLVTPGLIDAHTHLVFAGDRSGEFEQRLQGVPYQQIALNGGGILSTVNATRNASLEDLVKLAIPRAKALMRDGVTTIEIKSGYGLTVEHELKMLRAAKTLEDLLDINVTTTLLGAHALPPEFKNDSNGYIDLVCYEMIPAAAQEGLADAVDIFCEGIGFSPDQMMKVFEAAQRHGLQIKGHTEQLSNLGGSALAAKMGALSVDHIEYLTDEDVGVLAENSTVATLLPGAFYFLRETQQPPVDQLRQHRVPMLLPPTSIPEHHRLPA